MFQTTERGSHAPLVLFFALVLALAALFHALMNYAVANASRAALERHSAQAADSARILADRYVQERLREEADRTFDILRALPEKAAGNTPALQAAALKSLAGRGVGRSGGIFCLAADLAMPVESVAGRAVSQYLARREIRLALRRQREGYHEESDNFDPGGGSPVLAVYCRYFEPLDWVVAVADYKRDLVRDISAETLQPLSLVAADNRSLEIFFCETDGRPLGKPAFAAPHLAELAEAIRALPASGSLTAPRWWQGARTPEAPARDYVFIVVPRTGWVAVASAPPIWRPDALAILVRAFSIHLAWFVAIVIFSGIATMVWLTRASRRLQAAALATVEERVAARTHKANDEIERLQAEVADKHKNIEQLTHTNRELSNWVQEWRQTSYEFGLLNQTGDLLQACQSLEETDSIIADLVRELFPRTSGILCRHAETQNLLEVVASWGGPLLKDSEISVQDCWALRRGREYAVDTPEAELICLHLPESPPHGYVCLPMMAQGELLGMLHLQWGGPDPGMSPEAWDRRLEDRKRLALRITEQFSLALANLKLREMLRRQSIRDQLTGLYNRRHMEDALAREIHRANRHKAPMGIIMLDVDHFKKFNDTYGHEDGDVLLREMGALLRSSIRQEDIACRYGGEEFLVILPDAPLEIARERADMLRQKVRQHLKLKQELVTISAGVAVYPEHGLTVEAVLSAADQALYQAKAQGRDRVVVWQAVQ